VDGFASDRGANASAACPRCGYDEQHWEPIVDERGTIIRNTFTCLLCEELWVTQSSQS
jgi:hypothetical protein